MLYNGFVYLAKSDTGHYKIGHSKNPFGRIKHFDTIMPVKVKLIHFFPADDPIAVEKELHRQAGRIWGNHVAGEWFSFERTEEIYVRMFSNITHHLRGVYYSIAESEASIDEHGLSHNVNTCCYTHIENTITKDGYVSEEGTYYIFTECKTEDDIDQARSLREQIQEQQTND